jgi:proteic killer suppression protein
MIHSFKNEGTRDVALGVESRAARKVLPPSLCEKALEKLSMIARSVDVLDLQTPPSNNLEALKGDRLGQFSIRINQKYRICFEWSEGAYLVEICNYHRG